MDGFEKLTVAAAAARLGTSQDAVRKRIQRDTIKWVKDDSGRVYVYLDPSETRQASDQDLVQDESKTTIEVLQHQVAYLQEIIPTRDEEIRRHQHLLAAALERIPELEPAREPRESPTESTEEENGTQVSPEEKKRSWWRRFFGFE